MAMCQQLNAGEPAGNDDYELKKLIQLLDSENYEARENVFEKIVANATVDYLRQTLANADAEISNEIRNRLQTAIAEIPKRARKLEVDKFIKDLNTAFDESPWRYLAPAREVLEKLDKDISGDVLDIDSLTALSNYIGVTVVFDPVVGDPLADRSIYLKTKAPKNLLDRVCSEFNLKYVARGRIIVLTTPERANKLNSADISEILGAPVNLLKREKFTEDYIEPAFFNKDGKTFLTVGPTNSYENANKRILVRQWDLETCKIKWSIEEKTPNKVNIAPCNDDLWLLLREAEDIQFRLLKTGELIRSLSPDGWKDYKYDHIAITPDGSRCLTGQRDISLVHLWDLRAGKRIRSFDLGGIKGRHDWPGEIRDIALSADARRLLVSRDYGISATITLWDMESGSATLARKDDGLIRFSPDGKNAIIDNRTFWNLDLNTTDVMTLIDEEGKKLNVGGVIVSSLSSSARFGIISVRYNRSHLLRFVDLQANSQLQYFRTPSAQANRIRAILFSPDGKFFVTGGQLETDQIPFGEFGDFESVTEPELLLWTVPDHLKR
jgi:WD40 repeat protein